jgi:hypothetical protein
MIEIARKFNKESFLAALAPSVPQVQPSDAERAHAATPPLQRTVKCYLASFTFRNINVTEVMRLL